MTVPVVSVLIVSYNVRASLLDAVRALYASELGSLQEGPHLDHIAPDFTLKTIGLKDVSLKTYRGKNVVLLFYPLDWTPG